MGKKTTLRLTVAAKKRLAIYKAELRARGLDVTEGDLVNAMIEHFADLKSLEAILVPPKSTTPKRKPPTK